MTEPAAHWRQTLHAQLMVARKDRDATRVSALRSALSAIDNAETPTSTSRPPVPSRTAWPASALPRCQGEF
jgi:uncharacterized protein